MSPAMYNNLHKLVNPPFGPYHMSGGLRRKLDYLRTIGYVEMDALSRIPDGGPNLSDFVRPTETGIRFVHLREEMKSVRETAPDTT